VGGHRAHAPGPGQDPAVVQGRESRHDHDPGRRRLLLLAPFASIAVAVWSTVTDVDRSNLYWWIWGTAVGVTASGTVAHLVGSARRQRACYADGQVAFGVLERAIEHPGSGDDKIWYDLRISAVLPTGATLRRRLHVEGEGLEQRVGRIVRFRHNTLDPDALDDVPLAGWPENQPRWRERRS